MEAYNEALAEVKIAEKFIMEFDPTNIESRIKDLRQQLMRMGQDA